MKNNHRILKSLHTDDPLLARYLANHIMYSFDASLLFNFNQLKIPCLSTENSKNLIEKSFAMVDNKQKHKIIDIWNTIPHPGEKLYMSTCVTRLTRIVSCLGTEYIEDLVADPSLITLGIEKLASTPQDQGKNKGQMPSKKTTRETIKLLKQAIERAFELNYIKEKYSLLDRVQLKPSIAKQLPEADVREPLSEDEFYILFKTIFGLFYKPAALRKFKQDVESYAKANPQNPLNANLLRVAQYPYVFFYFILIVLYTGSRANAAATLRHKDINLFDKFFSFDIDKKLIDQNDIREQTKQLKTKDSARIVPMSVKLIENKFLTYLKRHEKKYGKDAFIFEEALITNTNNYRVKNITEGVNALFTCFGIKPDKNSKHLVDVHSLKTSFYTYNLGHIQEHILCAIAGQAAPDSTVVDKHYNKPSYRRCPTEIRNAVNALRYPHDSLLIISMLVLAIFILLYLDRFGVIANKN